jgi:hypothetical protein
VLVDWRGAALKHPEYFAWDGIHIGTAGARAYTLLIVEQLRTLFAANEARGKHASDLSP